MDSIEIKKTLVVAFEKHHAVIELTVQVDYTAEVIYENSSTRSYDSEADKYFFGETIHKDVEESVPLQVEVEIDFDDATP